MKDHAPRPDLTLSIAIWTLAIVSLVWVAHTGRDVLAPVGLGLVLGVVGAPLADWLDRRGVPRALLATGLMLAAVLFVLLVLLALGPAVTGLMAQLPRIENELQRWLGGLRDLTRGLETVGAQLSEGASGAPEALPGVTDAIWMAPGMGAKLLIIIGTFFFFTLTRPDLYRGAGMLRARLRQAERAVSRYFGTVAVINAGLGVAVMVMTAALGLPNPHLWGVAAGLLNFILYLGPIVMIGALTFAGLASFDGAYALLPPALFLAMNLTEAQFVTPALVGQKMDVNPLLVFLAVVVGLWLWGPIGAIVALPLLLWASVMLASAP